MIKRKLKHIVAILLFAIFVFLCLGSMGSSPSSYSGGNTTKCVMCDGYGTVNSAFPGEPNKWVVCPSCKGKGWI